MVTNMPIQRITIMVTCTVAVRTLPLPTTMAVYVYSYHQENALKRCVFHVIPLPPYLAIGYSDLFRMCLRSYARQISICRSKCLLHTTANVWAHTSCKTRILFSRVLGLWEMSSGILYFFSVEFSDLSVKSNLVYDHCTLTKTVLTYSVSVKVF